MADNAPMQDISMITDRIIKSLSKEVLLKAHQEYYIQELTELIKDNFFISDEEARLIAIEALAILSKSDVEKSLKLQAIEDAAMNLQEVGVIHRMI